MAHRAGWLCQTDEGSVALIPRAGLARRKRVSGRLFREEPSRAIGRRKLGGCKLFTLNLSGAYSAACPVIGGPYNLKQLGLLVLQDLHSRFKRPDRNNVAALKWCPCAETAPMFGHIFHECLFVEEMSYSIDSSDFNRDIY